LLFAYGSSLSTPLPHTPGSSSREDRLENVFPALAFVNWYNGHPAYTHLSPDLTGEKVTIIGQGNVAMDCARILLKPPGEFERTDMPSSVIDHLRGSNVKEVELVGRRGPGQVAFTTKEFREMISLDNDEAKVRFDWVRGEEMDRAKLASKGDRARSRLLDLMSEGIKAKKKSTNKTSSSSVIPSEPSRASTPTSTQTEEKRFKLSFLLSPSAFLSSSQDPSKKKINSIRWTKNTLLLPPSTPADSPPGPPADPQSSTTEGVAAMIAAQSVLARPTGEEVVTSTGMVIESVGYRGESIVGDDEGEDVPFDKARSRVMNVEGRVTDGSGVMVSRELVCPERTVSLTCPRGFMLVLPTDPGNVYGRMDSQRSGWCHRIDHATSLRSRIHHHDGSLPIPLTSSFIFPPLCRPGDGGRTRFHQAVEHEGRRVEGLGEDRQGREGDWREEGQSQGKVCFGGGYVEGVGLRSGK
jgi:adrenodoxin-NADP+ reductase